MKKIISLLLCVLLIGQSMGIVFASGEPINVAKNAAAFAYGTADGNDASLAVDGDEETSWTSLNSTVLKDYLILDLGKAYSVSSINVIVPEAVVQNFTVFGSNDPAQADREELTGKISGLAPGEKRDLGTILDATAYRYIIFEQDAAETTFGFTEIEVITQDEAAASQKAYGPATLVSFGKSMKGCTVLLANDAVEDHTHATITEQNLIAGNVRSKTFAGTAENDSVTPTTCALMFMVDLGTAKNLSHVAYQYGGEPGTVKAEYYSVGDFMIVGSNNDPCAKLTDAQGNPIYDVLADFDTANPPTIYNTEDNAYTDTGLLVFPVASEYQTKAYRYVGVLKKEDNETTTDHHIRLGATTIQAYTKPLQLENIAENKPAFSYNSQKGTSPSFAVDGDPATYWKSASTTEGSSVLYDNFVIDLGEKCPVYEIDVQLADNTSAKNFTIYGSENLYDVGKTKLCDVTAANITNPSGLNKVYKNDPASYRYIVFEHKPDGTDMGFAEIEVKSIASASGSGSVVLMSAGKPVTSSVLASYVADSKDSSVVTDGNQETRVAYAKADIDENLLTTYIDLEMSLPISHVLYQGTSKGEDSGVNALNNCITAFRIVGYKEEPSPTAAYDVLAEKTGHPPVGADKFELYGSTETRDTGLWVFPLTETKSYRYIGIVTDEIGYDGADNMRAHINTLQVYAKNSDVAAQLKNEGKKRLIISEKSAVADDAVSYESYVLNGDKADALIGLFGHYDAEGKLTERYYAQTSIPVSGAFADIVLKATGFDNGKTGNWDLVMLEDRVVSDYINNLEDKTRPTSYEGTAGSEYKYERIGNTFTITGKADCGVLGMLVLKQGASLADFGKDDIYTYQLAKAPQDAANPWDFTFVFDDVLAAGDYKVALFSDNEKSELLKKTETFTVVNEGALKTMFKDVDKNASFDLKQVVADNALFFGSELKQAVDATNSETISATVKLAAEAMAKGLLDGKEYNWSEPSSAGMTSLIKAALVIDACNSGTNVASMITSYGDAVSSVFDCDDYKNNTADFKELVPVVMAEDKPATAENLVKAFKRAIALSMIAGGTQEDRHKALENYKSELGIDGVLAETDKTPLNIAQLLSNDMETVKTVYAKSIKEAVEDIIEDLSEQGGDGLTSLGSQSSGKKPTQSIPSLPRDVIGTQDAQIGGEQNQAPQSSFNDIANHGWAQDAIERLAGLGILAGNGDGTFNPDGLLTREQAVKLLILTLDLSIDASQNAGQADNGYTDCDYEAWYYPYVTYAKVNKLVNGVGESEFGVGNLVTRQDLAVMIHRALKQKKVTMENSKAFADDDAVSAYAKTAVGVLGDMGLITGFPDGSFGPQETTTRAQAAVIFARFMDVLAAEEVAE